jgi:hypothetical protein
VVWPLVALELTVTFSVEVAPVEELVTDEGLNEPLVPLGNPLTLRFTVLGPLTCVIVTVYVPVIPRFTVSEVGVTAIVKSAEAVTVKEVVPEIVPDAAWIVVVPWPLAAAKPEVELIVATNVFEELQLTDDVMSFVEPSE